MVLVLGFLQRDSGVQLALPLVALCVVPPSESRQIHLVAIAHSGIRYYFAANYDPYESAVCRVLGVVLPSLVP